MTHRSKKPSGAQGESEAQCPMCEYEGKPCPGGAHAFALHEDGIHTVADYIAKCKLSPGPSLLPEEAPLAEHQARVSRDSSLGGHMCSCGYGYPGTSYENWSRHYVRELEKALAWMAQSLKAVNDREIAEEAKPATTLTRDQAVLILLRIKHSEHVAQAEEIVDKAMARAKAARSEQEGTK